MATPSEVPHTRTYFYAGGRYENNSTVFGNGPVLVESIYVEKLTPQTVKHQHPIVFWTGAGGTGAQWLNTPDGRQGWASYFLNQGYIVYLTDQPQRGRSAWFPNQNPWVVFQATYTQQYFTACKDYKIWPGAELHSQFPGTGKQGDPIFDQFFASLVQSTANTPELELISRSSLAALFDKVGPAYVVTHSQSGAHGFSIGDARPELVKGIIAVEPSGPPFFDEAMVMSGRKMSRPYGLTQTPIEYDPPLTSPSDLKTATLPAPSPDKRDGTIQADPPRKLVNLSRVPVLVVTSASGYHSLYDHVTVTYLRQAGVDTKWLNLPEAGIKGNGHFLFIELNNLVIAQKIEEWIVETNADHNK